MHAGQPGGLAVGLATRAPDHPSDPVELALASAIATAVAAGQWDAVLAMTAELRARREARANVVSLQAE